MTRETRDHRFPLLDLARIVAALSVVFYHWCSLFWVPDASLQFKPWLELEVFSKYGYLGVNLFFLISGFLILQSAYQKTVAGFIRARALRLWPAYLACCTLTYLITRFAPSRPLSLIDYLYNITMLNGVIDTVRGVWPTYIDGSYWTLEVEIKFYVLVACTLAAGQLERVEGLLWLWLAACVLYVVHPMLWLDVYFITAWAAYFVAGAAFFLTFSRGWTISRVGLIAIALCVCIVQALQFGAELNLTRGEPFVSYVIAPVIIVFFIFFWIVIRSPTRLRGIPARWITTLGALSYPIYLLHQELGAMAMTLLWSHDTRYLLLAAEFALLFALALAVHFGVERPIWALFRAARRPSGVPAR